MYYSPAIRALKTSFHSPFSRRSTYDLEFLYTVIIYPQSTIISCHHNYNGTFHFHNGAVCSIGVQGAVPQREICLGIRGRISSPRDEGNGDGDGDGPRRTMVASKSPYVPVRDITRGVKTVRSSYTMLQALRISYRATADILPSNDDPSILVYCQ